MGAPATVRLIEGVRLIRSPLSTGFTVLLFVQNITNPMVFQDFALNSGGNRTTLVQLYFIQRQIILGFHSCCVFTPVPVVKYISDYTRIRLAVLCKERAMRL